MQENSIAKSYWKKAGMIVAILILAGVMSACLDDDERSVEPVPYGYVAIYHAAPDAPGLDITIDDRKVNSQPFRYSDYSGYLNFYTGDRHIKFTSSGAVNTLVDTTFNVADGKSYSLFVIDRLSSIEPLIVRDSAASPAAGNAMVRFVNLSPDAASINLTDGEGKALFQNAAFKSVASFKETSEGEYSFAVKDAASGAQLLTADDIQLAAGRYYTIILRGFANPPAGNTNVLSLEIL